MLRAVSIFLLMTPLAVMQEEGGKPEQTRMQVRKEADVKYLSKEEGQHFKREMLLSCSATVGNSIGNTVKIPFSVTGGVSFMKTSGFERLL